MGKFATYMMAAAVGLVLAFALAMPSLMSVSPTRPAVAAPGNDARESVVPGAGGAAPVAGGVPDTSSPSGAAPALPDNTVATNAAVAEAGMPAPAPSAANQTVLMAGVRSGVVTAVVNGQATGQMDRETAFDITGYVRPGENRILLQWSGPVDAEVRVSHTSSSGGTREAGRAFLSPAGTQSAGQQTLTFYL